MAEEPDTTTVDTAAQDAAFGAGFGTEAKTDKPAQTDKAAKDAPEPKPAETPRVEEPKPEPEFVQITAKEWADIKAAAARTASYDGQFSKLFGTTGQIQKLINEQRAAAQNNQPAPAAKKFEIPKESFAAMSRDFPELAAQVQTALEAALSGIPVGGANDASDPAKLEAMLSQYRAKHELEVLEDAFPDWRQRVGATSAPGEAPDPNHPFRKWLATKPEEYQVRLNNSESAAVITRAIRTFERETKGATAQPATPARDAARAERIKAAVQPRGDNAGAAQPANTAEDAFAAGFAR